MTDADEPTHRLALDAAHREMEARMGDHAGWAVPLSYRGALAEAGEARARAAVLDVSHLTRVELRGGGALDLLGRLCTHDVDHQEDDASSLTCLCDEAGGVVDVGFLTRLTDRWLLTGSAGNREALLGHLRDHAPHGEVQITDRTESTCQLAVVGPEAPGRLDGALPRTVSDIPPRTATSGSLLIAKYVATRTAYADLWGLEVIFPAMLAGKAWRFITHKAGQNAIGPIGHAARDVLRIEAGLPRYGHEVTRATDPLSAGLGQIVDFGHDFLGADAVAAVRDRGPARVPRRVILAPENAGKAPALPRMGDAVLDADGVEVGRVTSGTFSPRHDAPIALAHLAPQAPGELRVITSSGPVDATLRG